MYGDKFERLNYYLPRIEAATQINDHIGARILLAEAIRHERALKVFNALAQIRSLEMETKDDVESISKRWTDLMLRCIEIHFKEYTLNRVRKCL